MSKCWSDRPEDRPTFLALERAFKFLIPDNDLTLMNTAVTNERMTYQGSDAHHEIPGPFNFFRFWFFFWVRGGSVLFPGFFRSLRF